MYSLKEGWQITYGADPVIGWDGLLYCNVTDAAITNLMCGQLTC